MSQQSIYLDHAAATPLDERVVEAMQPYFTERFHNPSAAYAAGRQARTELEEARHRLAMAVGAGRHEIILTAGATESVNLAINGIMQAEEGNIVIGATEHQAVRGAAAPYQIRLAVADKHGIISAESVATAVNDQTCLISVALADSELGSVQPLKQIAAAVAAIRDDRRDRGISTPLYLHSDGSQALGQLDVHVARLGVDLLTLSAAKCYGPKQVGLLWIRPGVNLQPLVRGGGQERGLRSGTENLASAVGFAVAAELAVKRRAETVKRLSQQRDKLQRKLTEQLPELVIDGHAKRRLPSHLHISLEELDAERVVFGLDSLGVMVATGAACAANKGTRSPTLEAIGMSESQADGSLRLSLGRLNDDEQIDRAAEMIAQVIKREKAL